MQYSSLVCRAMIEIWTINLPVMLKCVEMCASSNVYLCWMGEAQHMGADQKVLARSYVFGEHWCFVFGTILRWVLGGMPVHLQICRPDSLVDREMRSAFCGILDSLPVLGMAQAKTLAGLFWSEFRERSAKDCPCKREGQGRMMVTAFTSRSQNQSSPPSTACSERGLKAPEAINKA